MLLLLLLLLLPLRLRVRIHACALFSDSVSLNRPLTPLLSCDVSGTCMISLCATRCDDSCFGVPRLFEETPGPGQQCAGVEVRGRGGGESQPKDFPHRRINSLHHREEQLLIEKSSQIAKIVFHLYILSSPYAYEYMQPHELEIRCSM